MTFFRHACQCVISLVGGACLIGQLGCGGKHNGGGAPDPTFKVSGKVTYVRIPHQLDAETKSKGLSTEAAQFKSLPARGVCVRALQNLNDDDQKPYWQICATTYTDEQGRYTLSVSPNAKAVVELVSEAASLRLVADAPQTLSTERPVYLLQKPVVGDLSKPKAITQDVALEDFKTDSNTTWLTRNTLQEIPKNQATPRGSRPLAILDSFYGLWAGMGKPVFHPVDLHYSTDVRETAIDYTSAIGSLSPLLGRIAGSDVNDDAWDEGVLYPLLARHILYAQLQKTLPIYHPNEKGIGIYPPISLPASTVERPELALIEGLADVISAVMLKTPFLADTKGTEVINRNIRGNGNEKTICSSDYVRYVAWRTACVTCDAQLHIPQDWDKLNYQALSTFFTLAIPKDDQQRPKDVANLNHQLERLKATQTSKADAFNGYKTGQSPFLLSPASKSATSFDIQLDQGKTFATYCLDLPENKIVKIGRFQDAGTSIDCLIDGTTQNCQKENDGYWYTYGTEKASWHILQLRRLDTTSTSGNLSFTVKY